MLKSVKQKLVNLRLNCLISSTCVYFVLSHNINISIWSSSSSLWILPTLHVPIFISQALFGMLFMLLLLPLCWSKWVSVAFSKIVQKCETKLIQDIVGIKFALNWVWIKRLPWSLPTWLRLQFCQNVCLSKWDLFVYLFLNILPSALKVRSFSRHLKELPSAW